MVVTCVIEFDQNPYGTYFAGQVLTGKVTLQTDKVKQVKGVALIISGFAHTSWTEERKRTTRDAQGNSKTETDTIWYSGHEDYMASITYLLGSDSGFAVNIEPGIHIYNFACHIPIVCPSSFEGYYGHVRYTVRVALQRPWKFDQTFTRGFTVLKIMDLNYDSPILNVPAASEAYKTFCCGPCKSDPLRMTVNIPQSGYVPGQNIPVNILIANESNIPVEEIKVSLVMLVCYYSQSPTTRTKHETITVTKLKGDGVLRNCTKNYAYELPVPATPPTCFNLCRIIQIAYQLQVEAKVKGMHTNQVICIPVTIGNVPLMRVIQQQPTMNADMQRGLLSAATLENNNNGSSVPNGNGNGNMQQTMESHAVVAASNMHEDINAIHTIATEPTESSTAQVAPWSGNASIPPPSYEEAVHMKRATINAGEAHDYGESDFAPRYPVFSIPNPTAPNPNESNGGGYVNNISNYQDKSTWL